MPDAKLTDLPNVAAPGGGDILYIVNNNLSKSTTLSAVALNLPDILTTGNATISGNIILAPSSEILFNGIDYSNHVYNEISTNFIPNTGTGLTLSAGVTPYTVLSSQGHTTYALSADTVHGDKIMVNVPNENNYPGFNISFIQLGTSFIEVSGANGVTIGSLNGSLSSAGQYSKLDLTCIEDDLYTLTGDLSATA